MDKKVADPDIFELKHNCDLLKDVLAFLNLFKKMASSTNLENLLKFNKLLYWCYVFETKIRSSK